MPFRIRPLTGLDEAAAAELIAEIGGRVQARLGEVVDVLGLPGLLAWQDDHPVALASFTTAAERTELAAFVVTERRRHAGVGSALLEAVMGAARRDGARELWLVTTNDNVDALRFYQRRGFRLAELRVGAVDDSRRRLKRSIPAVGLYEIAMHDELVLVRPVEGGRTAGSASREEHDDR